MANIYTAKEIVLDTFGGAIDVRAALGTDSRINFRVNSIEWRKPTTVGHAALITDEDGSPVFDAECVTTKQSIIKYYQGHEFSNLKIGAGGVGSGSIVILLF